jgi:hypothetical protein
VNLFEECIEALGEHAKVLRQDAAEGILDKFDKDFPLTSWGRIDWDKVNGKKIVSSSIEDIIPTIIGVKRNPSGVIYVIGSDPKISIIESKLDKILEFFDDVEAVSPNSWLYCPSDKWVVEIYHDGEITIGLV